METGVFENKENFNKITEKFSEEVTYQIWLVEIETLICKSSYIDSSSYYINQFPP
jgi:hypothetical protein